MTSVGVAWPEKLNDNVDKDTGHINSAYESDANEVASTIKEDAGSRSTLSTIADTEDHKPYQYGWRLMSSQHIQLVNKPLFFLICLCLGGIAQGLTVSGISLSSLTSVEKQFGLKSSEVALFTTMYDTAYGICSVFIGYACYRHKPRSIGWGLFIMSLGAIVVSLPYFIIETYSRAEERHDDFCNLGNTTLDDGSECKHGAWYYEFIFNLGYVIMGIGATPLFILGPSHIDEVTDRGQSSLYLGAYYASTAVGPALGFIIALPVLNTWVDIDTPPDSSLTPDDTNWVGAWWLGFLIGAVLLILPVVPLLGFAKKFPDTEEIKIRKLKICDTLPENSELKRGWPATKALLRNPPFIFISLALTFESLSAGGYGMFVAKFVETQFHITASNSALYVGLVGIPGAAGGLFLGGYLAKRFHWNCKQLLKFCICMLFLAMIFTSITLVGCNASNATAAEHNLSNSCNKECNCNKEYYKPICSAKDGKTFYSPCFAGCLYESKRDGEFHDCACFSANVTRAESGQCRPDECSLFPLFVTGVFLLTLFTFMSNVPLINATFRVVNEGQGSHAMGLQQILVRFLGFIPSPILYGNFIDSSCRLWQPSKCNDDTTHCLEYNNAHFRYYMFGISLITKFFAFLCILIAYKCYRLPKKVSDATECNFVRGTSIDNKIPDKEGMSPVCD